MPYCRRKKKTGFPSKAKKGKPKKQTPKKGGFRAKWGGPLGHLTWPLHPPNKNPQKKQEKHKKSNKEGLGPSEVGVWATSPDP